MRLWDPHKTPTAVRRIYGNSDTAGQAGCGVEQTFDTPTHNRRSNGMISERQTAPGFAAVTANRNPGPNRPNLTERGSAVSIMLPSESDLHNGGSRGWTAYDLTPDEIPTPALHRFLAGFTPGPDDDCWLWHGVRWSTGYGAVNYDSTLYLAHRLSWVLFTGRPLERGLTIDHLCFVKLCVNPAHLEPVTLAENLRRARSHYGYSERPGPPDGKWVCPDCGTATRNDGIRRHQRRKHGRPVTPMMRAA